jgi:hypothetical protein
MILEELKNYRFNLMLYYEHIGEREHLGVADKFLIKQRYNQLTISEAQADKIDIEIQNNKILESENNRIYLSGNAKAVNRIIFHEKTTKYF